MVIERDGKNIVRTTKNYKNTEVVIASWNTQGLNREGKIKQLTEEARRYNIDILATQETNIKGETNTKIKEYIWLNGGGEESRYGTGFLINERIKEKVMDWKKINERISLLRLRGQYRKMSIINTYAPTETTDDEQKEKFYDDLENTISKLPKYDIKLIIGDQNAKIGKEKEYEAIIGKESLHEKTNNNGERLINFAARNNLVIKSTMQQRKNIYKETWCSPDGRTKNQIDHVIISKRQSNTIKEIRTCRGAEIGSDHYMIRIKTNQVKPTYKKPQTYSKRRITESIKKEEVKRKYFEELEQRLRNNNIENDIEKEWHNIQTILLEGAKTVEENKEHENKDWFDQECKEAIENSRAAKQLWLQKQTVEIEQQYKKARNKVKTVCRRKKRENINQEIEKLQESYNAKDIKRFYKTIKWEKKGHQQQSIGLKDKAGELYMDEMKITDLHKQHIEKIFTNEGEKKIEQKRELEIETKLPSWENFQRIIKGAKNNKSSGADNIPMELIKYGSEPIQRRIFELIKQIWKRKKNA